MDEKELVEQAEVVEKVKDTRGLLALLILNLRWVIVLVLSLGIVGLTFAGYKTKWFEKSAVELPHK